MLEETYLVESGVLLPGRILGHPPTGVLDGLPRLAEYDKAGLMPWPGNKANEP